MTPIKTKEQIRDYYGLCRCDESYKSRNLEDPNCPWHSSSIEEAMDEYAAQSSRLAGGEMWIRASEFNFKDREIYFGRRTFYDDLLHRVKIVRGSGRLTDGAFFWQGLNEPPVMERHFEELEILCEDQPPVSVLIETLDKAIQEINNALNQYK